MYRQVAAPILPFVFTPPVICKVVGYLKFAYVAADSLHKKRICVRSFRHLFFLVTLCATRWRHHPAAHVYVTVRSAFRRGRYISGEDSSSTSERRAVNRPCLFSGGRNVAHAAAAISWISQNTRHDASNVSFFSFLSTAICSRVRHELTFTVDACA